MAGYTRQAAANISNGNVADADDVDLEFDALAAAFSGVSGHLHDGSTGNGPKISILSGTTGLELSDSGSTIGPTLNLDRLSASPAANDFIGNVDFRGNDSVGNLDTYARIYTVIDSPTSGAEISTLTFDTISGGVLATSLEVGTSVDFYVEATPGVDNGVALGSLSKKWSDLFLADGGVINFGSGSATINESADSLLYNVTGSGQHVFGGGAVRPVSNDGVALGTGTVSWSDLFLADGGVINFNNSEVTLSHLGNSLRVNQIDATATAGPLLFLHRDSSSPAASDLIGLIAFSGKDSLGNDESYARFASQISDPTSGSEDGTLFVQTVNAGTLENIASFSSLGVRVSTGNMSPNANDGSALGTSGLGWSDLHLASGGLINWANGELIIQAVTANNMVFQGATSGYGFADGPVYPNTNNTLTLGINGLAWSDLFLGSGAVVDFDSGNVTITHSANTLTFSAASLVFAGTVVNPGVSNTSVGVATSSDSIRTSNASGAAIFANVNADATLMSCRRSGTQVGSISVTTTTTAFNTSSDGRKKENFRGFDSGYLIDNLEAGLFDWKVGGTGYGVIAQDAREVFPDAIDEDDEGYLVADYSKFVPILLREVKELRKRVAELEN